MDRRELIMPHRRRFLQTALLAPLLFRVRRAFAKGEGDGEEEQGPPPQGPMVPVAERYATLKSYSDTGTVTTNYQWPDTPLVTEHHRFETAFRAPRDFFFRFDQDENAGGDTYVIWCSGEKPFESWWKATGIHDVWDGGRGVTAFITGDQTTKGAANLVPPFFFPKALLYGPALLLLNIVESGEETVDGHPCRKITAGGRQSGVATVDKLPIAIWVDSDMGLIRKVTLDKVEGSPANLIDTTTFVIDPVADPELTDDRFTFTPPT
jgi:hypothetical protein